MLHIGLRPEISFIGNPSNDNEDLLALSHPDYELFMVRQLKAQMQRDNALHGVLLRSRKERRFFQELLDAESYIVLRYFARDNMKHEFYKLRHRILHKYLFPRLKRQFHPA